MARYKIEGSGVTNTQPDFVTNENIKAAYICVFDTRSGRHCIGEFDSFEQAGGFVRGINNTIFLENGFSAKALIGIRRD